MIFQVDIGFVWCRMREGPAFGDKEMIRLVKTLNRYLGICLFVCGAAIASSPGLEWTAYELDPSVGYERSRVVEVFEEGSALCARPFPPIRPKSQAVMVYEGFLESLTPESLLYEGVDGRLRIHDTEKFPHSIHGQMSMDFLGRNYGGSGVLIGPHHFLTAAHCVYKEGNWATNIRVRLALNGSSSPFGEILGVKIYAYSQWLECGNREYDIALVVLDRSVGLETGWSGLLSLTDDDLLKETVHVTGYPGDKGFKEMWTMDHPLEVVDKEQFSYKIDTFGGQSGGAVWIRKWGNPLVVGVHTNGGTTSNFGVRLSRSKLETIVRQWIEETGEIKTPKKAAVSGTSSGEADDPTGKAVFASSSSLSPGMTLPTAVVAGGAGSSTAVSLKPSAPALVIVPPIALGHEAVFERFMRGVLVYKPNPDSDVGRVEIPIASLADTLAGTFDLSGFGDTGNYISIHTGYKKQRAMGRGSVTEIWVCPKFLVERELATTARHFQPIITGWESPIAYFWTWCGYEIGSDNYYHLSATAACNNNELNLYEKFLHSAKDNRGISWGSDRSWRDFACTSQLYFFKF